MPPTPLSLSSWEWRSNGPTTTPSHPIPICETPHKVSEIAEDMPSGNETNGVPSAGDDSSITTLPPELIFNEDSIASIAAYCTLLTISAVGNIRVMVSLIRLRHRRSRVDYLLTHLALADLVVTLVMIPMEIGWRVTTQWLAGNIACKFFLFMRAFGLYLSSMVLICVSLDRYFAVVHPLKVSDARHRAKVMLCVAWIAALVCSLPQSIIFHVSRHPQYPNFVQCVSFESFDTEIGEMIYNLFCVFVMYLFPLFVIIYSYSCILFKLCNRPNDSGAETSTVVIQDDKNSARTSGVTDACRSSMASTSRSTTSSTSTSRFLLRRNGMSNIERARSRTLRMTVKIVVVFICCWTPYVVMTLWYAFHRESAQMVNSRVQDMLFITAVSNSCMNPLVYGTYVFNVRRQCARVVSKICADPGILKQCSCCACACVKAQEPAETIVMDAVPPTTRPSRRQFQRFLPNERAPYDDQKSISSITGNGAAKEYPGEYPDYNDSQASSSKAQNVVSTERIPYFRPRYYQCALPPDPARLYRSNPRGSTGAQTSRQLDGSSCRP